MILIYIFVNSELAHTITHTNMNGLYYIWHFSLDSFLGKSELTSALINQVQIAIKKMENIYSQHFSATYLCTTTVHNININVGNRKKLGLEFSKSSKKKDESKNFLAQN